MQKLSAEKHKEEKQSGKKIPTAERMGKKKISDPEPQGEKTLALEPTEEGQKTLDLEPKVKREKVSDLEPTGVQTGVQTSALEP